MPTHGNTNELQPSGAGGSATAASSHRSNLRGTKLKQEAFPKTEPSREPPTNLADVAFLDIRDMCAATRMSASWIHEEVRAGRFPQPLRFGPRCTRWRSADVRAWLIARAAKADADTETGAMMSARAKHASDAAQTKRRGQAMNTGGAL